MIGPVLMQCFVETKNCGQRPWRIDSAIENDSEGTEGVQFVVQPLIYYPCFVHCKINVFMRWILIVYRSREGVLYRAHTSLKLIFEQIRCGSLF